MAARFTSRVREVGHPGSWWPVRQLARAAAFLLAFAVLLFVGSKGRQAAEIQQRLDQISQVQDDLRREADNEENLPTYLGNPEIGRQAKPGPQPGGRGHALTGVLENALGQFDAEYGAVRVSPSQDLQLHLARATLANGQGRYTDALTLLDPKDVNPGGGGAGQGAYSCALKYRIRGDSYYGLQKWQECLDCYQLTSIESLGTLAVKSRLAECLYKTGRLQEALDAYEMLAIGENERGNTLLVQTKSAEAVLLYEKALKVQSWLARDHGRTNLTQNVATTCNNLGSAFLVEESPTNASAYYQQALLKWNEPRLQASQYGLAYSHQHLGDAQFSLQNFDAAIEEYGRGIAVLKQLGEGGASRPLADLALSLNNRGVTLRAQGQREAAIKDFEAADNIVSSAKEGESGWSSSTDLGNGQVHAARVTQVGFDQVMESNENGVEVSTHVRLLKKPERGDLIVLKAVITKNRGYTRLSQGKTKEGLDDLNAAAGLYSGLIEDGGQMDVSPELAMTLNSIAWVHATSLDDSARDGTKATKYARRACDLTGWRDATPIVTLAAACAEAGNYAEAVKWESKAVEIAPEATKAELRSRQDLYRSGKPYRAPTQ